MKTVKSIFAFLLIVLFAYSCDFLKSPETVDAPFIDVASGEIFSSVKILPTYEPIYLTSVVEGGGCGCLMCYFDVPDKLNSDVLQSDEFWWPESVSEKKIESLLFEYSNEITTPLETYLYSRNKRMHQDIGVLSTLLQCTGAVSITTDKELFGVQAGDNLIEHFFILDYSCVRLYGTVFQPEGKSSVWVPAVEYFAKEYTLNNFFLLATKEPFEGPVNLTIDIPVNKVMYLTYLRDKMRDGEAELSLVPWTFHGTATMNNIK